MTMAGKTERKMAMECREKSPGWPVHFSTDHGAGKKIRNIENRDTDFVNE